MPDTPHTTSTGWQPVRTAPNDVIWVVNNARRPRPGEHVARVLTLSDGRWFILKFSPTGDEPESYFILPEPP